MTAEDHEGSVPDLYRLLGVTQGASGQEIALAWRRRARDEHPDTRPADADAPGRFRALAEAWQVLGDPVRRTAYDRACARGERDAYPLPGAVSRIPVRHQRSREGGPPPAGTARAPLRAGPVWVERPRPGSPAAGWGDDEIVLAIAAELISLYLDHPW